MNYSASKICKIFSLSTKPEITREMLLHAEATGSIPKQSLIALNKRSQKLWSPEQIPLIGETFGFLEKPKKPVVLTTFVTKGGVLKTSLTLNLARIAALHNIKTCVIGLDMQGDITTGLGHDYSLEEDMGIDEALMQINETKGLMDYFKGDCDLDDIILATDLPTLSYIPETPELVALNQSLNQKNRREFWLKENVTDALKEHFDLILFDCSPNWNLLITNALTSCDGLLVPLECKINNFRNLKMFQSFLGNFQEEMKLNFKTHFIPTRFSGNRKLSREILSWYQNSLANCSNFFVRESLQGEEASALFLSLPEYAPLSPAAIEMNSLIDEVWQNTLIKSKKKVRKNRSKLSLTKRPK